MQPETDACGFLLTQSLPQPKADPNMPISPLDPTTESEIIEMALSDQISFAHIQALHGVNPDEVKALMRRRLKPGSYRAWRKRVREFSDRRAFYK